MTIQMKAIGQYFHVVLLIMQYKVVLSFQSVDEILKCDYSNESYWTVLSSSAVDYAVQGGSNFSVCGWNPKVEHFSKSRWTILILSNYTVCYTLQFYSNVLVLVLPQRFFNGTDVLCVLKLNASEPEPVGGRLFLWWQF